MIILRDKTFSIKETREKVPKDILEKANRDGVVQQDREGSQRYPRKS